MRKILILGALAAAVATPAMAEVTVSGNIALGTDYAFRGFSQTDEKPAVQGGFDLSAGSFYAGTWASNVDFGFAESIELDVYGGYKFALGPVGLDVGVIGYFYPGASDDGLSQGTGELDFFEGYLKGSVSPVEGLTIGGGVWYSPEFTAETGKAYYVEGNAAYAFSDAFAVSGAFGYQSIDDVSGVFSPDASDEYMTWNVGGTYTVMGVGIDLRYVGTDVEAADAIITNAFTTEAKSDDRFILTLKKAL